MHPNRCSCNVRIRQTDCDKEKQNILGKKKMTQFKEVLLSSKNNLTLLNSNSIKAQENQLN